MHISTCLNQLHQDRCLLSFPFVEGFKVTSPQRWVNAWDSHEVFALASLPRIHHETPRGNLTVSGTGKNRSPILSMLRFKAKSLYKTKSKTWKLSNSLKQPWTWVIDEVRPYRGVAQSGSVGHHQWLLEFEANLGRRARSSVQCYTEDEFLNCLLKIVLILSSYVLFLGHHSLYRSSVEDWLEAVTVRKKSLCWNTNRTNR